MRYSVEGKCPKIQPIDLGCECEEIIVDVGTGLIKNGNLISIDVNKLKELLGLDKQPPQPVITTRVTEREVTGTIRTRHYSTDGTKLFYDMLGQQPKAEFTDEWQLNNYFWRTGEGDFLENGEVIPEGAVNEVPVGKYVTTETLTDGVVTNTSTEYVDYKVPYDVRGLKAWEISSYPAPTGHWVSVSTLPEAEGGIGDDAGRTIEDEVEWFKKFFAHDGTDGKTPPTGFLKEGETVVTFLYEKHEPPMSETPDVDEESSPPSSLGTYDTSFIAYKDF